MADLTTKIYLTRVIGDGKTMETAFRPEIADQSAFYQQIEDKIDDYVIVESVPVNTSKLTDTQEL